MAKNRFVTVVVALVGAGIVAALFFFNRAAVSYNQYIVGNLIGLFWIPMLTILFLFREDPEKFGLSLGSSRRVWLAALLLFVPLLVVLVVGSRRPEFQSYYPLFRQYPEFAPAFAGYPTTSPLSTPVGRDLMIYAALSYGMYMFCWEFFFRGYLLLGLARSIGWPAIIVQALAFGVLHWGKPPVEVALSFGAGVILGIMALRGKSFVPCFVLHWAASLAFDVLIVVGRH